MTLGEAVELIGVMLGLMVFPGIPLAILAMFGLYYVIAYRELSRRRKRRFAWRFIVGCFVMGFVVAALMGCASQPSNGHWSPAPWVPGAFTPSPWIT